MISDEIYELRLLRQAHSDIVAPGMRERTVSGRHVEEPLHDRLAPRLRHSPAGAAQVMLLLSVNETYGVNVLAQAGPSGPEVAGRQDARSGEGVREGPLRGRAPERVPGHLPEPRVRSTCSPTSTGPGSTIWTSPGGCWSTRRSRPFQARPSGSAGQAT